MILSSDPTRTFSTLMPFIRHCCIYEVSLTLNINFTFFHRLWNIFTDRHLLSSPIFLFGWKVKKFTDSGPEKKLPVLCPFILVFQTTSFAISTTTRKQHLPSFEKKTSELIFTIDSVDSCTLFALDNSCSTKTYTSDTFEHWTITCRTIPLSCSHLRTGRWAGTTMPCEIVPNNQSSSVTLADQSLLKFIQDLQFECPFEHTSKSGVSPKISSHFTSTTLL